MVSSCLILSMQGATSALSSTPCSIWNGAAGAWLLDVRRNHSISGSVEPAVCLSRTSALDNHLLMNCTMPCTSTCSAVKRTWKRCCCTWKFLARPSITTHPRSTSSIVTPGRPRPLSGAVVACTRKSWSCSRCWVYNLDISTRYDASVLRL